MICPNCDHEFDEYDIEGEGQPQRELSVAQMRAYLKRCKDPEKRAEWEFAIRMAEVADSYMEGYMDEIIEKHRLLGLLNSKPLGPGPVTWKVKYA